jgi:hypothetical protein
VGGAITFTLPLRITSIPDNLTSAEFAVHVGGYASGCNGWVSDGTPETTTSNPSCTISATVPEPSSFSLLGIGFVAASLWRMTVRRRAVS